MNGAPGAKPLALTLGEPAGIAPDITLTAWRQVRCDPSLCFFCIGDRALLKSRAERLAIQTNIFSIDSPSEASAAFATGVPVLPMALASIPEPGSPQPDNAQAVIQSIERAVDFALAGKVAAIVTNPIHKKVAVWGGLYLSGTHRFSGAPGAAKRPAGAPGHDAGR